MSLVGNEVGYLDLNWWAENGVFTFEAENHDGDVWRTTSPINEDFIRKNFEMLK